MSDTTKLPHRNCYRVTPRFIAGEYPGSNDLTIAEEKVARHLAAGITFFLDLTEVGELEPYREHLATAGYRRLSIRDRSTPKHPTEMIQILDTIDEALAAGHTIYVHCWGGIGRTGTVVGCWLVRHGQSGAEALATIARHWQGVEKSAWYPRSPETDEQHAYVRGWQEALKGRVLKAEG